MLCCCLGLYSSKLPNAFRIFAQPPMAGEAATAALLALAAPPTVSADAAAAALLAPAALPPVLAEAAAAALLAHVAPPPMLADAAATALLAEVALPTVRAGRRHVSVENSAVRPYVTSCPGRKHGTTLQDEINERPVRIRPSGVCSVCGDRVERGEN